METALNLSSVDAKKDGQACSVTNVSSIAMLVKVSSETSILITIEIACTTTQQHARLDVIPKMVTVRTLENASEKELYALENKPCLS